MRQIFKIKRELVLWMVAFLLLVFIIGYTIYSVSFLANALDLVLKGELVQKSPIVKFDFEKLGKLLSSGKFSEPPVR